MEEKTHASKLELYNRLKEHLQYCEGAVKYNKTRADDSAHSCCDQAQLLRSQCNEVVWPNTAEVTV